MIYKFHQIKMVIGSYLILTILAVKQDLEIK
jgi:hypothetical protein